MRSCIALVLAVTILTAAGLNASPEVEPDQKTLLLNDFKRMLRGTTALALFRVFKHDDNAAFFKTERIYWGWAGDFTLKLDRKIKVPKYREMAGDYGLCIITPFSSPDPRAQNQVQIRTVFFSRDGLHHSKSVLEPGGLIRKDKVLAALQEEKERREQAANGKQSTPAIPKTAAPAKSAEGSL